MVEPTVVKTVSNNTVSAEKERCSLENKISFLQLDKLKTEIPVTIKKMIINIRLFKISDLRCKSNELILLLFFK